MEGWYSTWDGCYSVELDGSFWSNGFTRRFRVDTHDDRKGTRDPEQVFKITKRNESRHFEEEQESQEHTRKDTNQGKTKQEQEDAQ